MVSIQGRFLIKCGYSGACMVYFRYSFQLIKFTFILIIFSESTVCQSELRKLMQCWLESKRAAIIAIASHYFFPSLFTKDLHLSLFFWNKIWFFDLLHWVLGLFIFLSLARIHMDQIPCTKVISNRKHMNEGIPTLM